MAAAQAPMTAKLPSLIMAAPKKKADLVDRAAHVEGDHGAQDDAQQHLVAGAHHLQPALAWPVIRSRIGRADEPEHDEARPPARTRTGMTRMGMIG